MFQFVQSALRWRVCLLLFCLCAHSSLLQADTAKVVLTGVEDPLLANIKAFLSIRSRVKQPKVKRLAQLTGTALPTPAWKPPSAAEIGRLHKVAVSEITQALQPFGYYHPTIQSDLEKVSDGEWRAAYEISKGPQSSWGVVRVGVAGEGAELPWVEQLQRKFVPQEGEPVNHTVYSERKAAWLSQFLAAGFLNARFVEAVMLVDLDLAEVDVQWQFDSGPRFYFGDLTIEQPILRSSLVGRYHDIKAGEPFSTARLLDLQLKLMGSNYFDSVRLDVQRDQAADQRVPVKVLAQARKKLRFETGLGYGTDTGPRLSAGIENRRVNDRGHRYRVNGRTSQLASELQFEYDIPIKNVAQDRWRMYAQVTNGDVGDADTTQYSVGAAREDSWWKLRRRIFLNLEHSNFSFGDEPSQTATLLYPGITLSYDVLDNPQYVRRGFSLAATVQGGSKAAGSETDFVTMRLTGRGILPLGRRGRLITALNIDAVEAKRFAALPPSQRFFLGGDRSVRGYSFQSISPENTAGDDIGGPYSLSGGVEIDYQVRGPWRVAAFLDAGDVATDWPTDFKKGVGLGLRYQSPVGMIRLDLAHPLDDPDTDVRLHISIGPDL